MPYYGDLQTGANQVPQCAAKCWGRTPAFPVGRSWNRLAWYLRVDDVLPLLAPAAFTSMTFLTNVTGPPVATAKPLRTGSYNLLLTEKGFVVGDPRAFEMPELSREVTSLRTGSGFVNGRLHLHSRRFPMYYPGSVPKLLLISPHLTVMPLDAVPPVIREQLKKEVKVLPELDIPHPDVLRNVMPGFEIFQDNECLTPA